MNNRFKNFFDLTEFSFASIFEDCHYPWQLLEQGKIAKLISTLNINKNWKLPLTGFQTQPAVFYNGEIIQREIELVDNRATKDSLIVKIANKEVKGACWISAGSSFKGDIYLGSGSLIEEGATVSGPTLIEQGSEIRQGAYLRGNIIAGQKVVFGHTSEVKGCIFLNMAKAPHFAYVGDSILGNEVNLGAGTKVSNLKITGDNIVVIYNEEKIDSGLRKFGAIIGDKVESGCNSVINPGVLIEKNCLVYPAVAVKKDHYRAGSIIHSQGKTVKRD